MDRRERETLKVLDSNIGPPNVFFICQNIPGQKVQSAGIFFNNCPHHSKPVSETVRPIHTQTIIAPEYMDTENLFKQNHSFGHLIHTGGNPNNYTDKCHQTPYQAQAC
eukprot:TRINITY_DN13666_c0_g6_i4.p1 TRINITY_DN13666_c0_g6~~TRINITY_DN13666_c0_g6_i4.p1  ORF type:complete len:108 (+),score=10.38 TRINITY_DN13666_c0_g6_i4:69-392(+)